MIAMKKQKLIFAELVSSIRQAHDLFSVQANCSQIVESLTPQFIAILKNKNQCQLLTSGILICKKKNKAVVEYALSDIHKPISVSEYQVTPSLPKKLNSTLPSIEEIEKELGGKQ